MTRYYIFFFVVLLMTSCGESQTKREGSAHIGGPCEGCEAIYEYADQKLTAIDTLPEFKSSENPIKISGTIYKKDGKTPAENVLLYVYHTNGKGLYPSNADSKGWERRHGYLRGWVKTDRNGFYAFYTSRPASYPNSNNPQHIHATIKEPDKNEFYIDDFYFDDDPNLTQDIRNRSRPRAGSGIITLRPNGQIHEATRHIILGLNIPDYPDQ